MSRDLNSEDSIGLGVVPGTIYRGLRITAASAYLSTKPDNLTIITQSEVTRILFEGKKATGINLADGTQCLTPVSLFAITCSNRIFI